MTKLSDALRAACGAMDIDDYWRANEAFEAPGWVCVGCGTKYPASRTFTRVKGWESHPNGDPKAVILCGYDANLHFRYGRSA